MNKIKLLRFQKKLNRKNRKIREQMMGPEEAGNIMREMIGRIEKKDSQG